MTEKPSGATSTRVRLTPSTAIEPFGTIRGVQAGSMREGEELPLAVGPALAQDGRGVDVPLDEVAAEPVADAERPLQVHRVARRASAQVRAEQGLRPRLDVERRSPSAATTVRQQPLTATLSPERQRLGAAPARRASAAGPSLSSTTRSTGPGLRPVL